MIRYSDLLLFGLFTAALVTGCSSYRGHPQPHTPALVQRVQSIVAHWFGPKEKRSSSRVSQVTPSPLPKSVATTAAPHAIATAPIRVLAQLPTPSAVPHSTEAPRTVRTSEVPGASPVPRVVAPSTATPVPVLAPDAKPAIVDISISATDLHSGDIVSGTVITSSNVASVEARIKTYSANLNRLGVGRFGLTMRVPSIPFFLHGTYQLQLIARNTAGVAAEEYFPISVH